ncbi:hypothetical protein GCM10010169_27710 [Micromonospora fulviviridis]|uniref:hypothetical protein n=1 Tax=Micromonospora fulviviridis TaxID=47860 RepID=UPI00166434E1|nr:hypothetical protein [Micromonospora fulviviridis]GGR81894.1 hypothetical protein GCM10010169_27710 [Micromonospora fulviviridis]
MDKPEDPPILGGTPWVSNGPGNNHGVPPTDQTGRHGGRTFASRQDLEDADDILFAHPPRKVTRWLCGCGEEYPCPEVRFARLVRHASVRTAS